MRISSQDSIILADFWDLKYHSRWLPLNDLAIYSKFQKNSSNKRLTTMVMNRFKFALFLRSTIELLTFSMRWYSTSVMVNIETASMRLLDSSRIPSKLIGNADSDEVGSVYDSPTDKRKIWKSTISRYKCPVPLLETLLLSINSAHFNVTRLIVLAKKVFKEKDKITPTLINAATVAPGVKFQVWLDGSRSTSQTGGSFSK